VDIGKSKLGNMQCSGRLSWFGGGGKEKKYWNNKRTDQIALVLHSGSVLVQNILTTFTWLFLEISERK
jgi:hypothetical protein